MSIKEGIIAVCPECKKGPTKVITMGIIPDEQFFAWECVCGYTKWYAWPQAEPVIQDPPMSVIARAKGQLVEFTVTACGELEPTTVLMAVKDARALKLDLDQAIWDASKAVAKLDQICGSAPEKGTRE